MQLRKITVDEFFIVIALVIAGVLFLAGGDVILGVILCVVAVVLAVILWTSVRERLGIPPSPRPRIFR